MSDAARQAVAIINGEAAQRPSGAEALKDLSQRLPDDVGFLVAFDLERGQKTTSLGAFAEMAKAELAERGLVEEGNPFLNADTIANMRRMMEQRATHALGSVGNLRVDAGIFIVSSDVGPRSGYIALILKGLCDPERIFLLLPPERMEEREIDGRTVQFMRRGSLYITPLDPNTFLLVNAPREDLAALAAENLVTLLTAPDGKPPSALHQTAFDEVIQKKVRVAAAGALSEAQKGLITAEAGEDLARLEGRPARRQHQVEVASMRMLLALPKADSFAASLHDEGVLTGHAVCPDEAAAQEIGRSLTELELTLSDMLAFMIEQAGGQAQPIPKPLQRLKEQLLAGPFWEAGHTDTTVTATTRVQALQRLMQLTLGIRASRPIGGGAPQAPAPPQGPAPTR